MASRRKNAGRSPLASPFTTVLLLAALLFIVIAFVLEGDLPLHDHPFAPAQSPYASAPSSDPAHGAQTGEDAAAGFELHALAVGKADCLLLICDGQTMLVDGGNEDDAAYIKAYLQKTGVQSLDYLINTHPHEDHLGSLDKIVLSYPIGHAYLSPKIHTTRHYEELLLALDAKEVPVSIPKVGETLAFGGSSITFLSPDENADLGDEINNWSIVFLLEYGEHRFLFMGDAESKAETGLRNSGFDLSADVLKLGHHGSKTSSKKKFLDEVMPDYAVITCDKTEEKGAPDMEVLERLEERQIIPLRTDELGDIVIRSDGKTLVVPAA